MSRFALRVMRLLWSDRRSSLFILLVLVFQLVYSALLPLGLMWMIDYAIVPGDFAVLFWIVVLALLGVILTSVLGLLGDRVYARLVADQLVNLYRSIFEHLQKLSLGFYRKSSTGDLLARYSSDLTALEGFLIPARQLLLGVMTLAVNAIILLTLQWYLALVVFAGFAISFILPNYFSDKAFEESKDYKDSQAGINAFAQENIAGQESIKSLGAQDWFLHRFIRRLTDFRSVARRAYFLNYLLDRTAEIGVLIVVILTLCLGSILAFRDVISIGVLSAFVTILLSMSYLISDITWLAPQVVQARAGMERMDGLLEQPVSEAHGDKDIEPLHQGIDLQDVWFSYTGERHELRRISLEIRAGSFTTFVGSSGSGKSTLLNLLMRYDTPGQGKLTWDGVPFDRIREAAFCRQVAIVPQNTFLFNLTIMDNIKVGAPGEPGDEAVFALAQKLGIHEMISELPAGYDSLVGAGGVQLSGGQRQRIAILRALIRQPSVLIMDEGTSALDALTEDRVLTGIRAIMASGTVINITHRLVTARNPDRVFVLHQGEVVEQGDHASLRGAGGFYQELFDKQRGFEFSDDGREVTVTGQRLRAIPLLESLDANVLEDISNFFITRHFEPGEDIIEEGASGDTFYLIVRGQVDVLKSVDNQAQTGSEAEWQKVSTLSDGDFFGEIALLEDVPRTATIRVTAPTTVLALQRKVFNSLLNQAPHLREKLTGLRSDAPHRN